MMVALLLVLLVVAVMGVAVMLVAILLQLLSFLRFGGGEGGNLAVCVKGLRSSDDGLSLFPCRLVPAFYCVQHGVVHLVDQGRDRRW